MRQCNASGHSSPRFRRPWRARRANCRPRRTPTEARILAELKLFVAKPRIVVHNVAEEDLAGGPVDFDGALAVRLCAPVELEIAQIEGDDRTAFLAEYGLEEPASVRSTQLAYEALDLISFFTVGPDEVRAWPIPRGSDAVTAAGKIHSDLARGFIRAEVTPYDGVREATDAKSFKELGQQRLEGKEYVVQDGDVLNIRFSV